MEDGKKGAVTRSNQLTIVAEKDDRIADGRSFRVSSLQRAGTHTLIYKRL